ncbi:beta-phosphoglucomutase [Legionella geestiana]|uniref:Beta-phosphoglucomutase n=1 Tax=Legionella geestiana TaxID=45065 RepID=A0A0W0U2S8_9GAMM|nr:HAD family phosphatase [Legionella geestiana]KTD02387.1 beta-phosphoglucomutase [Legionella geestiana]QBS12139.1 HAD family phosphatase [Legionella geestiana]QDQ40150.1 HAD family phosphatase [Legionella geestiana]STX53133.1 HAD-superfamily hydrolase [Legionella geestiana]
MNIRIENFNAIIFDFDGVILDSEHMHYEAYERAFKEMRIPLTYDIYRERYLGMPDIQLIPAILRDFNLETVTLSNILEVKRKLYLEIIENTADLLPIPGFSGFLQQVTLIRPVAICTSASRREITGALEKLKAYFSASVFKPIITADDVVTGKPSPEGYLMAAELLKLPPEKCLVIEDSPKGVHAARAAGMTVCALLTTHAAHQLGEASHIAPDYKALSRMF